MMDYIGLFLVVFVASVAFGAAIGGDNSKLAKQCEEQGYTVISGKVFRCEPVEPRK